jgi:hypothetical protein
MLRIGAIFGAVLLSACATSQTPVVQSSPVQATTPLQQVLKAQPNLLREEAMVEIRQVFNRKEAPTAAEIVVLEAGLMDDSVNAIRTVYQFKLAEKGWTLVDQKASYKCHRGKNTKTFQTELCA